MLSISQRKDQPPGFEETAPVPEAGDRGLGAFRQLKDKNSLSSKCCRCKSHCQRRKSRDPMTHIGQVVPQIFHNLILRALSRDDLRPDVRAYLEGLL